MADRGRNPHLPLHCAESGQAAQSRMSRTTSQPLHSIVLSRNMGHYRNGCWILERDEDQEEVAERSRKHGLYSVLPHCCGAGG